MEALGLTTREIAELKSKLDATQWTPDVSSLEENHVLPSEISQEEAFSRLFPNVTMDEDS